MSKVIQLHISNDSVKSSDVTVNSNELSQLSKINPLQEDTNDAEVLGK